MEAQRGEGGLKDLQHAHPCLGCRIPGVLAEHLLGTLLDAEGGEQGCLAGPFRALQTSLVSGTGRSEVSDGGHPPGQLTWS